MLLDALESAEFGVAFADRGAVEVEESAAVARLEFVGGCLLDSVEEDGEVSVVFLLCDEEALDASCVGCVHCEEFGGLSGVQLRGWVLEVVG